MIRGILAIAALLGAAILLAPAAVAAPHAPAAAAPSAPGGPPAPGAAAVYDVRGGDTYYIGSSARCVVGFAVSGGYVTASPCGRAGDATSGYNRVAQGVFRASSWPGDGGAHVAVNSSWVPRGVVNRHDGSLAAVRGAAPAPVGASACKSGSTTGWHCGTIQSRGAVVTFPDGTTLRNLIRTTICAEPGELGAPLVSGGQAQGVLIHWTGNCATGGVSYYIPIGSILSRYGLTLTTS
ncbi:S1 family peptidase [Bailinhaonella thermotolerans]|uniref:Streptogrisin B n=1 Tax=Bailinhaonella thermotolerans TaxID=1070861 RepID=A0A3A4B2U5_9ACTN|nr:S1 family peptidase [Bailinhaonella thermotolerans]RJL34508.1 hypothetical protein D5H75_08850 [Bailinhaonella thermotolerans]